MSARSAYQPYQPARRPGGRPKARPSYRVVVHRQYAQEYAELVTRVGVESAQQLWDHLASAPGAIPSVNTATVLKGKAGAPDAPGFSRTVHYEVSGKARVNYQYNDAYRLSQKASPHPVVRIKTITYSSH